MAWQQKNLCDRDAAVDSTSDLTSEGTPAIPETVQLLFSSQV